MWHTGDAASAVASCRAKDCVLIVLLEPSQEQLSAPPPATPEPTMRMYARGATSAMHRITFKSPLVEAELARAPVVLLRLSSLSPDAESFTHTFRVGTPRPALIMVSPNGRVLVLKHGYVAPAAFCGSLRFARLALVDPDATAQATLAASALLADMARATPPSSPPKPGAAASKPAAAASKPAAAASKPATAAPKPAAAAPAPAVAAPRELPAAGMKLRPDAPVVATARIAARLPDGGALKKEFARADAFEAVRAWVCEESGLDAGAFVLGTAYPQRRVYDAAEDGKTLEELELVPSAALVVALVQREPPPAAGVVRGAASAVTGTISSAATFLYSWLPTVSAGRGVQEPAAPQPGAASMAEVRRRDDAAGGGLAYDNGNSTQFGAGDVKDEAQKREDDS